jgi:hypothetical protein
MFQETIQPIIDEYHAALSDGKLTLTEAMKLFYKAVTLLIAAAQSLQIDGAAKKVEVMTALGSLIDTFVTPINVTHIPLIEGIFDRWTKSELLAIASNLIDGMVAGLKSLDVLPAKAELPEG